MTDNRMVNPIAWIRATMYDRESLILYTTFNVSWIAEIPTDADHSVAMVPNVTLLELAAAAVALKVLSTAAKAGPGITNERLLNIWS